MAGLYLHVPYCKQACTYCDFFFSTNQSTRGRFAQAVVTELELRAAELPSRTVETVYLGGGTPSLLSADELALVFNAIRQQLVVTPDAEITLEANPDDLVGPEGAERMALWRSLGVNRLSLGIQSFDAAQLAWMHRAHTAEQAEAAVDRARGAGFTSLSVDLIYDLPGLSLTDWAATLDHVLAWQPEHISAYGLTIEPRTARAHAGRAGRIVPAPEGAFAEQFRLLHTRFSAAGYEHYEVSNLARPGHRARHNSSYWQGAAWLALGPSAHGSDGAHTRYHNLPQLHAYLEALELGQLPPHEREQLSPAQRQNEYLLTRLRTREGLEFERLWALDTESPHTWRASLHELFDRWRRGGLAWMLDRRAGLTPEGWLVADHLTSELLREV